MQHSDFTDYACDLAEHLCTIKNSSFQKGSTQSRVLLEKTPGNFVEFDLTPFYAQPDIVSAATLFSGIRTLAKLIDAYQLARQSLPFEDSLTIQHQLHPFATSFTRNIISASHQSFSDEDAAIIASWVSQLDIYTAVKCIESLLNSHADLQLLKLARDCNWNIHFDHLAIRCGNETHNSARIVSDMLIQHHGYRHAHMADAHFYRFDDGWSAYLLYKILDNGQVLRLFIDQSDHDHPKQIIQHWNRLYGFTAHHLAMRATINDNEHQAITLTSIGELLAQHNIKIMTPTGMYTQGLLQQVFTRPEITHTLPPEINHELTAISPDLPEILKNGKLLELVSRREVEMPFKSRFFSLYGLKYNANNPLHSVPAYHYFLPAQAAHVIRTSVETS